LTRSRIVQADRATQSRVGLAQKKNSKLSIKEKKALIESKHPEIPVYRQCKLLGLSKAAYYYRAIEVSVLNLALMRLIAIYPYSLSFDLKGLIIYRPDHV
jgi:hypothetical protein